MTPLVPPTNRNTGLPYLSPHGVDSLTAGYTEVVVAELSRIVARRVCTVGDAQGATRGLGRQPNRAGQWLRGIEDRNQEARRNIVPRIHESCPVGGEVLA